MRTVNIEILKVGTWNSNEFSVEDLKDIVRSFRDLKLAGRVPVGIGHQRDDTREAEGWIAGLYIAGDVLVATVDIINDELLDDIAGAKFRNVSVELLPDVKHKNMSYAWVLVGLAILGAVPPAVIGLQPLNEAIRQRLIGAAHGERVAFAYGREPRAERQDNEVRLRAENAKLQLRLIDELFNRAIESGRILPRDRESFRKRHGGAGTVTEAEAWIASSPKPIGRPAGSTFQAASAPARQSSAPDDQLVDIAKQVIREARKDGEVLTFEQAALRAMRSNPALAREYQTMPTDLYGGST